MTPRALIPCLACCLALFGTDAAQPFQLPNGLRVILVENHERPLVRLELRTAWDPVDEPPGKSGLGGILAGMLKAGGTGSLKREAFQRLLDDKALRLSFSMTSRAFAWSVLADSQGQDGAFECLAMAVTRPDLDGVALDVRRQSWLQAFKERTPRMRAEDRFLRRCGEPSRELVPEEEILNHLELQDLVLFARRTLRPGRSVLVVQGDLNLPQARQLAMLHLGAWAAGTEGAESNTGIGRASTTRTWVVQETGSAVQVKVGGMEPSLSEAMRSICAWLVRQELASGPIPPLAKAEWRFFPAGGWLLDTTASPQASTVETMDAVRRLVERLREKRFDSGELTAARSAWNAERRNRALHPQQEAVSLADRALRAEGPDDGADTVKAEDIQAAFRRMLAADACFYFVLGTVPEDPAWLEKAGLGPAEIIN